MVVLADVTSQSFVTLPWTKERSKCSIWSLLFLFGTKNFQDMNNFVLILKMCITEGAPCADIVNLVPDASARHIHWQPPPGQ